MIVRFYSTKNRIIQVIIEYVLYTFLNYCFLDLYSLDCYPFVPRTFLGYLEIRFSQLNFDFSLLFSWLLSVAEVRWCGINHNFTKCLKHCKRMPNLAYLLSFWRPLLTQNCITSENGKVIEVNTLEYLIIAQYGIRAQGRVFFPKINKYKGLL